MASTLPTESSSTTINSELLAFSIKYPILKDLGKTSIRNFLTDRKAYVREIKERSAHSPGTTGRPVSLTFSIHTPLLESLVELRQFGADITELPQVTEDLLQTWLDGRKDIKKDGLTAAQVNSLVSRSLHINMSEKDCEQRILMFFSDYKSLLRKHGMPWLVEDNTKMAVGHITDALKPSALKRRVLDDLTFGHVSLKKDFLGFMKHVIKRAELYADHPDIEPSTHSTTPKVTAGDAPRTKSSPPRKKEAKTTTQREAPDCLNPSCNEKHMLKNCVNTTKERKEELFAELSERRRAQGIQRFTRSSTTHTPVSSPPTSGTLESTTSTHMAGGKSLRAVEAPRAGRLTVTFQSTSSAIALPDSGADDNVIPRSLVTRLEQAGIFVPMRTLADPMKIELAVQGPGLSAEVRQQAQLTVELHLAAGPLRLRNCKWLVAEHAMDEVLIGRPLLEALGLNTAEHLSSVREEYHDLDCSHIPSATPGGKLTRLLLSEYVPDLERSIAPTLGPKISPVGTSARSCATAEASGFLTDSPAEETQSDVPMQFLDGTSAATSEVRAATEVCSGLLPAGPGSHPPLSLKRFADSVTHGERDADPIQVPQLLELPEITDLEKVQTLLEGMIYTAQINGLPQESVSTLRSLICDFSDIWSISLQPGEPAKIPPLEVRLKPGAVPVRVRVRRYSEEQRNFLSHFIKELEAAGLVYRNPRATWCAAPLLVPKPGPAKFRFTVDLRPVNKQTIPCSWPMPHIESELTRIRDSSYFATFDLSHGYWQLPLAPSSQDCQSFITPDGVYSPTRVLHGSSNAVTHLQASLQEVFRILQVHLLSWLDDLLLHSPTLPQFFEYLRTFFTLCRQHNLKLHPGKCVLFATVVRWCGRLISNEGAKFDPHRIQGLLDMPAPSHGADLQQFTCALNWMRTAIPSFAELVSPLHKLLEAVYAQAGGKRTKSAAARVSLSDVGWSNIHIKAFTDCQKALARAATLAHPSADKRICLYTDASQDYWSSITTQVPPNDLDLPRSEQRHEPLAFLSGSFVGAMSRWPIIEKEAYAIVVSCDRLDWLFQRADGFSLFTDHHNLLYVFNPGGRQESPSAHSAAKLIRWALRLSAYSYTIEHVPGEENVWADMLTRWGSPAILARASRLMLAPISPSLEDAFVWPDAKEIRLIQDAARYDLTETDGLSDLSLSADSDLYLTKDGQVWVPAEAQDLQLRICIVAHTGPGGHRGHQATLKSVSTLFYWPTLTEDLRTFCNTCLHCRSTIGGDRTPRPFGEALHASRPNEILHFDYLYMGSSTAGPKYLLLIKDDLSGYLWLIPCVTADAESTVNALTLWFAAFGVALMWVSDQGSHFKNLVMTKLRKALRSQHHFTTAYTPWANGTIERACRDVLRAVRALLSEFKLPAASWPDVARLVQSALNNSPSPQRGNIAPLTAFTGRSPDSPLQSLVCTHACETYSLDMIRAQQLMQIDTLRASIDAIHRQAATSASNRRASARAGHNKPGTRHANFEVGDFVLIAKREFRGGEKLSLRWRGPYRVVSTLSEHLYDVEDLLTKAVSSIHSSRLRFYHDASLEVSADLHEHLSHQNQGYEVRALQQLAFNAEDKIFLVLVSWKGFEEADDTWEPLLSLHEDIPQEVLTFLGKVSDRSLAARARASLPQ